MPATATDTADLEQLEDAALIPLARQGRPQALRRLFSRHRQDLAVYLKSRYGFSESVTEDILQDTLDRAYRHLHRFEPDRSSWRSWLHTIAINLAKNEFRNRETARDDVRYSDLERDDPDAPPAHSGPHLADPEARADGRIRRRRLREIIVEAAEQLKPHHRVVFLLREFDNYTYDEISDAVGLKLGTVKSRLTRSREEFRENLEEIDPEIAQAYDSDRTKRPRSV